MEDVSKLQFNYTFSKWEEPENDIASLSSSDRDLLIDLVEVAQNRPIPRNNVLEQNSRLIQNEPHKPSEFLKPLINTIQIPSGQIKSSQQFLTWYASIESGMEKEQDGPNYEYVEQLENNKKECNALLMQLEEALNNLENLSTQYIAVSNKTSALHTDCEHLLAEQTRLSSLADVIDSRLNYFLEINKISQKLRSPAFQVTSDEFIPLLAKIDECINYITNNPSYLESASYLAKYKQYLSRALSMVKTYVTKSLQNATQAVFPQVGSQNVASDNALVLYYQKFRTNAPRIKTLMTEIEDRVDCSQEYTHLLADCHQFYFSQRKMILDSCVYDSINVLSKNNSQDYCSFIRSGCAFLGHVCEDEYSLFHQFFSMSTPELDVFLQGICSLLYDIARPSIIHIDHLETLSELCNILRQGLIEEHIQSNPTQLASLTTVVGQLLEDCQERLVYRAHIYIQTDIANFTPSPGDLAYPAKLEMMQSIAETLANQRKEVSHSRQGSISSMTSIRTTGSDENSGHLGERVSRIGNSPADLHGMWYPSVRRTLVCLSKVYRCVDKSIFQGVCLEALSACMQSLFNAATSISKTSTLTDAQLFEIKHLLILREQLAPFQIDANLRSLTLDWSKLKDAAMGLLHKTHRVFSLTSNNSLLEFIAQGAPQVTEHILDSKRDVDNNLKRVCEQFICSCTDRLVGHLTAFKAKAEVIVKMTSQTKLKQQSFATPEMVAAMVSAVQKNIRTNVPLIQRSLKLYLSNQDTEFIIFKPIRNNSISLVDWLFKLVQEHYTNDERTIIACPSQQEVSALITLLCSSDATS